MTKRNQNSGCIQVLMCCSDLSRVKGGMVTVVKNLLSFRDWKKSRITYIPTHIEHNKVVKAAYFAGAYARILAKLLFGKVDLVYLHVSERGSVYRKAMLLKLAKAFGKPVVLHHHGADFDPFFRGLSEKDRQYVVEFLKAADTNVVLSERIRQEFLERAPEASYTVLHNAVPLPEENRYDPANHLIVTLGRLGERKGTYDLLKALRDLDAELPKEIQVCLCGDGDVEKVQSVIAEYGLQHRIAHVGWATGEQKDKILEKALCHVLPSYREGLPMAILETMSLGIPNITTRIASIPEVIDSGVHGILIEPGDIEALKDALRKVCCDREVRQQLSREAYRQIRERFSVDAAGRKLEEIYETVLNWYSLI